MMMQLTADLDNEDLRSYLVESQPLLVRHTYVGSLARATDGTPYSRLAKCHT